MSTLNFDDVWNEVLPCVEYIYRNQDILPKDYMKLYNYVWAYCTNEVTRFPSKARLKPPPKTKGNNRQNDVPSPTARIGRKLYNALENYLKSFVKNISNESLRSQGCYLLHKYTTNWARYLDSIKKTNGACQYLNRHWVRLHYDSGRRDIHEIFTLAEKIWKKHVFERLNPHLTQTCLRLIEAERNSIYITTDLIRKVIQSYVELGSDNDSLAFNNYNQITSSNLEVYKNYFEADFLQDTEQFYLAEAPTLLQDKTGAERIEEEKHRALSYLHPSTVQPLVYVVEQIFINQPEEWRIRRDIIFIYAEAETFLLNEKFQVLALLFKLVKRIENGIVDLKTIFENYLHQNAHNTIENNPTSFVERFSGIYTKSHELVQEVFNGDQNFIDAVYKAYKRLMKDIRAMEIFGNASQLLAQYCISILPKQNGTVERIEFEKRLNLIIFILKCQENEDALKEFCKCLKELLSNQSNISINYIKTMISKLEEVCDIEQTSILRAEVIYKNNVKDDRGAIDVLIGNDEQQILLRDPNLQTDYCQIRKLMRNKIYQDLPCLCKSISQKPNGQFYLKKLVQEFIHQMGIDITENILSDRIREPFHKVYIEGLLNFHEAGLQIVTTTFGNQPDCIDAFKESFTNVINYNPVTRTVGNIEEFLVQYFDSFLKRGIETVEQRDIEKKLNDCKILLKYIDDINGFKKSYEVVLESRLFAQSSISHDLEKLIISNLEEVCGILYRSELEEKADHIKREKDDNMNINISISFEFFYQNDN